MLHGHSVVWLPALGYLVDTTAAGQYFADEAMLGNGGPVIIVSAPELESPRLSMDEQLHVEGQRANLALHYALAPREMTAVLLDQAEVGEDSQLQRRGMNVAAEVVMMLSSSLPPEQFALIPHE